MRLSHKLLLAVLPAAVISGQAIIFYSKKAIHHVLVSDIESDAIKEASDRATAMAPAFAAGGERLLLPALQALQGRTQATSVAALDGEGKVLAHTNVAEVGKLYRDLPTLRGLSAAEPAAWESQAKWQRSLSLSIPVFDGVKQELGDEFLFSGAREGKKGRRVGALLLVLPLAETLAKESQMARDIYRIVLAFGGATVIVLLLLLRRMLAPIRLLAAGTDCIRRGEYGTQVPIVSEDEIGTLARGFNEMSRNLEKTTVSKDFFNGLLDNIRDQLIVIDIEGRITLVNPAMVGLLGYAKEELIGGPAARLFDQSDEVFVGAGLRNLKERGSFANLGAHFITKTGDKVPVLVSASVLKSGDGRITGFIGTARDVSDLRKLEARMHQSEKLSAVGQLAAGVAHEVNNPLGVILGFAQGIARQTKPGDPLELPIKSIEREALRCKALVQNLLTFARTSQSDRTAMDLNQTVEQALTLIQAQAKMTQVQIKADLVGGLPSILGNRNQIEQMILNLAKNAIDAMPNGGLLSLSTQLLAQTPNSWVCLKVADTGTGIPPAAMSRLFEPFFTTKPVGQGTGLGLSLVNDIVRKHSGDVEVESRPGMTVFSVKFPVRTGKEMDERLQAIQREKLAASAIVPYHKR